MLIPRDQGVGLLPHRLTAAPKATDILAIHFSKKPLV